MSTDVFIENTAAMATISVQIPGGEYITRVLREGQTVSVGSDGTAELRLESEGVGGLHCLLSVIDGVVNVRDCYSQTGTYVNEARVQDVDVNYDCEVRVGQNVIELKLRDSKPAPNTYSNPVVEPDYTESADGQAESPTFEEEESENGLGVESIQLNDIAGLTSHLPVVDHSAKVASLTIELEEAQAELEVLRERLDSRQLQNQAVASDPFQQEMIELLREEVLSLQEELRTNSATHLPEAAFVDHVDDEDLPTREEVEKLVDRLEVLLSELHQKDENIRVLQDLVLAADNANQAEKDEREQLARWLGEFEERFELLSEEWQAENEQLKIKMKHLQEERTETQAALSANSTSAKTEALQRLTENLRTQITAAQEEMESAQHEIANLKVKVKEAQGTVSREEEIRLSRERAEIARMRHDLEVKMQKAHADSEPSDREGGVLDEAELRLREFRDHVRETGSSRNSSPSLSSRLLNLWGRLG